jgi:hypothetical protein
MYFQLESVADSLKRENAREPKRAGIPEPFLSLGCPHFRITGDIALLLFFVRHTGSITLRDLAWVEGKMKSEGPCLYFRPSEL